MRLAVYTEYVYRRIAGVIYAERAFALFVAGLAPHVERLRLVGRLDPLAGDTRYPLPPEIELAPLAHYPSLAKPWTALRALAASVGQMYRALDEVEAIWVLGPNPHAIVMVALAIARRRRVVLGVRQDFPRYVRMRRPNQRWTHWAADVIEAIWMALGRRLAVVAVGPELSARYHNTPALLDLVVSLVPAASVASSRSSRDYHGDLTILSVGRLEEEKNPLLLADVLAQLTAEDPRWRLTVCGEGELAGALQARLSALGVDGRAELRGYVAMGEELLQSYRSSHVLLHISWTEGFPQVLIEAFATGLPVVATAVGGVTAGVGDAGLLIAPGDAQAAVDALRRIAADTALRERLTVAGLQRASALTLEAQTARLALFLASPTSAPR